MPCEPPKKGAGPDHPDRPARLLITLDNLTAVFYPKAIKIPSAWTLKLISDLVHSIIETGRNNRHDAMAIAALGPVNRRVKLAHANLL